TSQMTDRMAEIGRAVASLGAEGRAIAEQLASGSLPTTRDMPDPIARIVEDVAATAISHAFLVGVPLAVMSLITICFLPNTKLTTQTTIDRLREQRTEEPHTGSVQVTDVALASSGAVAAPDTE